MATKETYRVVVAAAIYNHQGQFLLGKRHSKDDNLPDFWSTPAGHVETTEHGYDSLEQNLVREVQEELGVTIGRLQYLDSHVWIDPEYKKLTVVFLAQIIEGEPRALEETAEIKWYTIDEIETLTLPPNVERFLIKAASINNAAK